jgi:hypothetical protein
MDKHLREPFIGREVDILGIEPYTVCSIGKMYIKKILLRTDFLVISRKLHINNSNDKLLMVDWNLII